MWYVMNKQNGKKLRLFEINVILPLFEYMISYKQKEVDENLQLKKYPGIYVCGEALDVDGDCGGYNLHFAFASGVHVAKSIKK